MGRNGPIAEVGEAQAPPTTRSSGGRRIEPGRDYQLALRPDCRHVAGIELAPRMFSIQLRLFAATEQTSFRYLRTERCIPDNDGGIPHNSTSLAPHAHPLPALSPTGGGRS